MSSKKISYENLNDVKKNDGLIYHITNDITYMGSEKPNNPKLGNIAIDNKTGLCSIYSDNSWIDIATTICNTSYFEPKVEYRELKPSICSCCGAPLRNNKCEYCGTEYC